MKGCAALGWDLYLAKGYIERLEKQITHLKDINTRMENRIKEDEKLLINSLTTQIVSERVARGGRSYYGSIYSKGVEKGLEDALQVVSLIKKTRHIQ